jgi:hypothetical protein
MLVDRATSPLQPGKQAGAHIVCQLELDRSAGLLLDYHRSSADLLASDEVPNLDLYKVTAAQFAVDSEVE